MPPEVAGAKLESPHPNTVPPPIPRLFPAFCLALAFLAAPAPRAEASGSGDIAAVSSKASNDYVRMRRSDGTFEPEYYVFGSGGRQPGAINDETIDSLKFLDIAHVIAGPLADRGYIPAREPAKTKILIMVYWGVTDVPAPLSSSAAYSNFNDAQAAMSQATSAPPQPVSAKGAPGVSTGATIASSPSDAVLAQMSAATVMLNIENRRRDQVDFANAALLGYDSEDMIGTDYGNAQRGLAFGARREMLVSEIEDSRYFVVLMAYDFQLLAKKHQHKELWETRFSIRAHGHDFTRDLPKMVKYSSQFFGQNTRGLVRDALPEGKVSIGDLKQVGTEEPK